LPVRTKIFITLFILLASGVLTKALWFTPITTFHPGNAEENALKDVFVEYITARNNREVERFMATLHEDCRYMVTKDLIATKQELRGMLPGLWMQYDDDTVAFGKCMAWECWNENYYRTGMLVNPKFTIEGDQAYARFKFHSGLFLDENFFQLVKDNGAGRIKDFRRPVY
jgi:hypothetical protein